MVGNKLATLLTGVTLSAIILAIGSATPVMAKTGGIKVSDSTVECGDTQKEVNLMPSGSAAIIWLNDPSGNASHEDYYTITCNDGTTIGCTAASFSACGESDPAYYFFEFTTPSTSTEKVTACSLKLFTDSACTNNISSDTWIQP